mgnify:CR=1 FL=1
MPDAPLGASGFNKKYDFTSEKMKFFLQKKTPVA